MPGPCFFMKRPPSVRKCCLKERVMECQILQYTALPLRVGGKSVHNGPYLFRLGRMFNYPVFAALLHPGGLDNQ